MKTPVAVIIFNRPDQTAQLRDRLRAEEARELFIISDGPRSTQDGEIELVQKCRNIFSDWPNKVHLNCATNNMGCKTRVSLGLDWVFEQTDRAIILEDDCHPHPHFFKFCDEMLEHYQNEKNIMSVCGTNPFPGEFSIENYTFSKYNNCWGWATWKDAWEYYDDNFEAYSLTNLFVHLREKLGSSRAAFYWSYIIHKVLSGKINSWAYCWSVSCFLQNGLHIYPKDNLILNNGFSVDSTHTTCRPEYAPCQIRSTLSFPLVKNKDIRTCVELDNRIEDTVFSKSFKNRLKWLFTALRQS